MEAKNVAKGSVKSCGQQIKCIRNWKSQYTSGQRSWQWRIVQSNALTPLLTSVQCPVHCAPFSPSRSLLRPPPGMPWDPVALSCKLILWPDCRIDNDNENENEDYLPNGVNSLLNNIALTCQQQNYLAFFACVATDLLACPAHTQRREQLWQQFAVRIRLHSNYKLHSPERNVQLKWI